MLDRHPWGRSTSHHLPRGGTHGHHREGRRPPLLRHRPRRAPEARRVCAPDLVGHAGAGSDLHELKRSLAGFLAASPTCHRVHHLVQEGDLVSAWLTYTATHQATSPGSRPATGRSSSPPGTCSGSATARSSRSRSTATCSRSCPRSARCRPRRRCERRLPVGTDAPRLARRGSRPPGPNDRGHRRQEQPRVRAAQFVEPERRVADSPAAAIASRLGIRLRREPRVHRSAERPHRRRRRARPRARRRCPTTRSRPPPGRAARMHRSTSPCSKSSTDAPAARASATNRSFRGRSCTATRTSAAATPRAAAARRRARRWRRRAGASGTQVTCFSM